MNSERIRKIEDLHGLSVTDSKRLPHPADLAKWSREGLYTINVDRGVFVVLNGSDGSNLS